MAKYEEDGILLGNKYYTAIKAECNGNGDSEITSGEYVVRVIDYDGTILKEQWLDSGATFEMPSQPSHSNLVFQEWSSPVDIVDNKVTVTNSDIIMGAVYTTASGLSEFDIVLTKVTGLDVTLNMDGTKNWGDGTIDTLTTHTYADYGNYTITCDGTTMTTSSSTNLFGASSNSYVLSIRLGNINKIYKFAFFGCISLLSLMIPNTITEIGEQVLVSSMSLKAIILPSSISKIGTRFLYTSAVENIVMSNKSIMTETSNLFTRQCYNLQTLSLPDNLLKIGQESFIYLPFKTINFPKKLTTFGSYSFSSSNRLKKIKVPSTLTHFNSYAFNGCKQITEFDLSELDIPPSLNFSWAVNNLNPICKFIIKDQATLELFQTATNWSALADYMYIKE